MPSRVVVCVLAGLVLAVPGAVGAVVRSTSANGTIVFVSNREADDDCPAIYCTKIYSMKGNGKGIRRLTSVPKRPDSRPDVSPDGRKVVFSENTTSGPRLFVMNIEGSGLHRVGPHEAVDPAWSPDGRRIAFTELAGPMYVVTADGTGLRRVPRTGGAANPDWSPDGKKIVFDNDRDLFVVNTNGTHLRRLTRTPGWEGWPAWSPNGREIVYHRTRHQNQDIDLYVMNADGTHQRLLRRTRAYECCPAWSTDGRKIVFVTDFSVSITEGEIYVMNADGKGVRRLTHDEANDIDPTWGRTPKR